DVTSTVPFAAILRGRQRLALGERTLTALAFGAAGAGLLRFVHDGIFAHGGAWVIGVTVGGAWLFLVLTWRRTSALRSQRAPRRPGPRAEEPARHVGDGLAGDGERVGRVADRAADDEVVRPGAHRFAG